MNNFWHQIQAKIFFSLFIERIPMSEQTVIIFIINVLILAGLHSLTCNAIHREPQREQQVEELVFVYLF